ncbi:hypothetical protein AAMO2058_001456600 [Amorphochlora amoebiformis]
MLKGLRRLRLIRAPLRSFSSSKVETGITGLPAIENAKEVYMALLQKTIEEADKLPSEAEYGDQITRFAAHRLKMCEENDTVEAIEDAIAAGEIEELIDESEHELKVLEMMQVWKPWEEDTNAAVDWTVPDEWKGPYYDTPEGSMDPHTGTEPRKA